MTVSNDRQREFRALLQACTSPPARYRRPLRWPPRSRLGRRLALPSIEGANSTASAPPASCRVPGPSFQVKGPASTLQAQAESQALVIKPEQVKDGGMQVGA